MKIKCVMCKNSGFREIKEPHEYYSRDKNGKPVEKVRWTPTGEFEYCACGYGTQKRREYAAAVNKKKEN